MGGRSRGKKRKQKKEKEIRGERAKEKKEKTKKEEKNRSKESSRGVGDLEWRGESIKVKGGRQEISSSKVPQVNLYL